MGVTPRLRKNNANLPIHLSCERFAPKAESLSAFITSGIGLFFHTSFNIFIVCSVVCPLTLFTIPCFCGRMYLHERKLTLSLEPCRYFGPIKSILIMLLPSLVKVLCGYFIYLLNPFLFFCGLFTIPASLSVLSTKEFDTFNPI